MHKLTLVFNKMLKLNKMLRTNVQRSGRIHQEPDRYLGFLIDCDDTVDDEPLNYQHAMSVLNIQPPLSQPPPATTASRRRSSTQAFAFSASVVVISPTVHQHRRSSTLSRRCYLTHRQPSPSLLSQPPSPPPCRLPELASLAGNRLVTAVSARFIPDLTICSVVVSESPPLAGNCLVTAVCLNVPPPPCVLPEIATAVRLTDLPLCNRRFPERSAGNRVVCRKPPSKPPFQAPI
ncbi:hypothetical protein OSB04_019200 [Centaurea solstitialis]|uniref:Uncharacterized protein n=1 Tax=Centaurea solstitialis TaxID=347529 RepID=A0AA38T8B5_9ASTR|nr:hypothetical protein OSB04_019200 [Centaurea solstitialis]